MSEDRIHARFHVQFSAGFDLDVGLDLPGHGVTVLFGRSGCGKTTVLRCLAGLHRAEGELRFGSEIWQDARTFIPTHQRPLAYVFQEPRLFPHLDVQENLLFGYRRIPETGRLVQPEDAIRLLGLESLLTHRPSQLSGGQQQRVAIARALLTSPRLLLMDEPLASLDLDSKAEILPYLERLRQTMQLPIVYVTHAPEEMTRLADHLVLLEAGKVRAAGPLNELLTRPELPLAHLNEAGAVMEATVVSHDTHYRLSQVSVPGGLLTVALCDQPPGRVTRVRILARDVSIALQPVRDSSIQNCLQARVVDISADRDESQVLVRLDLGGVCMLSRVTRRSADRLGLVEGMLVFAVVKAVALMR
ncbi:MAG: molybdenum ABC transporter ATP-binding protein [Fluviicoccus sp.]|uniref:molybdenum ABC transporter ATP-binding protein n=1 Tax=Fluviicoccus sp. TaxID=2003552 RepID=UPI00271B35CD|nr:molybdenum ABC transporter ATP-binding protein [Fluviicoccus sp.]MDO8329485.1 molybdenum ABC transporter ATP-binding protein [Fluviicoccus sp.]